MPEIIRDLFLNTDGQPQKQKQKQLKQHEELRLSLEHRQGHTHRHKPINSKFTGTIPGTAAEEGTEAGAGTSENKDVIVDKGPETETNTDSGVSLREQALKPAEARKLAQASQSVGAA